MKFIIYLIKQMRGEYEMKKRLLCFVLVIILVLLTACGTSNNGQSKNQSSNGNVTGGNVARDVIKIGLDVDSGTIDPRMANNVTTKRVIEFVFDGLVQLNENLEPIPMLAEKWEQKDDKTWVFHLRKGVKFHDGSDFTAEDVKYTYDTMLDPNFPAVGRSNYTSIKEIVVIDSNTVQFNLKHPYAPLFSVLDLGIIPSEADSIKDFGSKPIGTGPYKLLEWQKNSKVLFTVNDSYWNGNPKTKNIEIYIIPDNSTRIAALEAGDVDLIHSPLSSQDVERMKNNNKFTVYKTSGLGLTFLYYNQNSEILKDKDVRIGLAHLIDKETISSSIYHSLDTPATSVILPTSWAYSDKTTSYKYDESKGREILAKAGWTDTDGDGFLDKNGKKLSIKLSTHTEDPNRIQTIEYIQNLFTKNGIDASVTTNEWATFSSDMENGKFEIAMAGLLNIFDPDKYLYGSFHKEGGLNYQKYSNPEYDKLVEVARASSNREERAEMYRKAAQIINDDVPQQVLLYQAYIAIYSNNMEGYVPYPSGSFRSLINAQIKK